MTLPQKENSELQYFMLRLAFEDPNVDYVKDDWLVLRIEDAKKAFKDWLQFRRSNLHDLEDKRVVAALIEAIE
jgi:hypothetical protein